MPVEHSVVYNIFIIYLFLQLHFEVSILFRILQLQ